MTKQEVLKEIEKNEEEINKHLRAIINHKDEAKSLKSRNRSLNVYLRDLDLINEYDTLYELNRNHFKTQRKLAYKYNMNINTISVIYYRTKKNLRSNA